MFEITTFRLRAGADPDAFTTIQARLQTDVYYQQPGLVRRTSGRAADGTWVDVTVWDRAEHADAAAAQRAASPVADEADALIDASSVTTRRYDTL